jgi:hypothetical protein
LTSIGKLRRKLQKIITMIKRIGLKGWHRQKKLMKKLKERRRKRNSLFTILR